MQFIPLSLISFVLYIINLSVKCLVNLVYYFVLHIICFLQYFDYCYWNYWYVLCMMYIQGYLFLYGYNHILISKIFNTFVSFFDVWIGECVGINRSIKMHINSAEFFQENIFLTLTFQMKQRFQTLSIVWFCFLTCLFQWHPYNFHHFCGYDFAYLKKKTWYVVFMI